MNYELNIRQPDGSFKPVKALQGDSAYETAVKNGFEGTEQEWLDSLSGTVIDDTTASPSTTYSSRKINSTFAAKEEFDTKASQAELNSYTKNMGNLFDKFNFKRINKLYCRNDGKFTTVNDSTVLLMQLPKNARKNWLVDVGRTVDNMFDSPRFFVVNQVPEEGTTAINISSLSSTALWNSSFLYGYGTYDFTEEFFGLSIRKKSSVSMEDYNVAINKVIDNLILLAKDEPWTTSDLPHLYVPFKSINVEKSNLSSDLSEELTNKIEYINTRTIKVGTNSLSRVVLNDDWEEKSAGEYTYSGKNLLPLLIATTASLDSVYMISFDTTYTKGEGVTVSFGNSYSQLVYNGRNSVSTFLTSTSGRNVLITPLNGFDGTISNIKIRKVIQDNRNGEEIKLDVKSVVSPNHDNCYGFWNTFLGDNTAQSANGTTRTIAIGINSLRDLTGGHRNIGVGTFTMSQMIGGERNIAIGADAMLAIKHAANCVAIGDGTLYNGDGHDGCVAIGSHVLYSKANSQLKHVVAVGNGAGMYHASGDSNVFIGVNSAYRNEDGTYNVVIGSSALGFNGSDNTLIGSLIYGDVPISNSIGLGKQANPTKSNQMMLGNDKITEVVMCGNKKINFNADGTVTWEQIS